MPQIISVEIDMAASKQELPPKSGLFSKLEIKRYFPDDVALRVTFNNPEDYKAIVKKYNINDFCCNPENTSIHYQVKRRDKQQLSNIIDELKRDLCQDSALMPMVDKAIAALKKVEPDSTINFSSQRASFYHHTPKGNANKVIVHSDEKCRVHVINGKKIPVPEAFLEPMISEFLKEHSRGSMHRCHHSPFKMYETALIKGSDIKHVLDETKKELANSNMMNSYGGGDGYSPLDERYFSAFISILKRIVNAEYVFDSSFQSTDEVFTCSK